MYSCRMSNTQSNETSSGIAGLQPPGELEFSRPETWPRWLKRFERYLSVSDATCRGDKKKIDMLCYLMGERAEEILSQVMPDLNATTLYEAIKIKFNGYFAPKKNVVFERFKFNSRTQQTDESVDSFVTALYTLAETCEFGELKEDLIRDRLVIGIRDSRTDAAHSGSKDE